MVPHSLLLGMDVVFISKEEKMRIFLLSGKAGSGKNEVAKYIQNYLDKTVITSFSKYIKLFALEMTSWDGKDATKPRQFLQEMGDELRAIQPDFLTKRIKEDLQIYEKYYDNVVISDVRLLYELEYFKKLEEYDVIAIRIHSDASKRNLTEEEKKHHTELELDTYAKFDYEVHNPFNETLEKEVIEILKGLK